MLTDATVCYIFFCNPSMHYIIRNCYIGGKHEETRRDETITRGALSATFQGQTVNSSAIQK